MLVAAVAAALFVPASARAQVGIEAHASGGLGGWSSRSSGSALGSGSGGAGVMVAGIAGVEFDVTVLANPGNAALALSPGGRVRLMRPAEGRPVPFLTAGYTHLSFFEGEADAFNVGGGLEYPLSRHRMLRFEFRDIVRRDWPSHFWTVRVGMTFR
jgi:hypothetical protein